MKEPRRKKLPFSKDDYFKQLDAMLGIPGQAPIGGSLLSRVRQAFKRPPQLPKLPKV